MKTTNEDSNRNESKKRKKIQVKKIKVKRFRPLCKEKQAHAEIKPRTDFGYGYDLMFKQPLFLSESFISKKRDNPKIQGNASIFV